MYKKLLYNHNNCILDVESGKVVFSDFKKYIDYLDWKVANPELEENIVKDKEVQLRWNLGAPHKTIDKDGVEVLTHYYPTGKPHKIEINKPEGIKITTLYNKVDKIISKTTSAGNTLVQDLYDSFGRVMEESKYEDGKLVLLVVNDYDSRVRKHTENGVEISKTTYYDHLFKHKHVEKIKRGNYILFREYFKTGTLRGQGKLEDTVDKHMNGVWKFYHQNGNLASTHRFKSGKLIKESILYREDGTLNLKVKHES